MVIIIHAWINNKKKKKHTVVRLTLNSTTYYYGQFACKIIFKVEKLLKSTFY